MNNEEPIIDLLDTSVSTTVVDRVWNRIEERRQSALPSWLRVQVFLMPVVAAALACLWIYRPQAEVREPSQLSIVSHSTDQGSELTLSDGSQIELNSDAKFEVLRNSGSEFFATLRSGVGHFEVKPGGPRRWSVETGLALVEVVGTGFTVKHLSDGIAVSVEHGVVLVSGEKVPGRVQRLERGQSITIYDHPRGDALEVPPTRTEVPKEPDAPVPTSTSTGDVMLRADAERARGNFDGAMGLLRIAIARSGSDPMRPYAAFTLGKLLLEKNLAAEAATAFRTVLRANPPPSLEEDALARLVEAEARSGQPSAAQRTALIYREKFPGGRSERAIAKWLEQQ